MSTSALFSSERVCPRCSSRHHVVRLLACPPGECTCVTDDDTGREVSPFVATDLALDAAEPPRTPTVAIGARRDFAREALRLRLFGHTRGPQEIGRYVVERTLGAGGMGMVVVARDPLLGRQVAIKLLREDRDGGAYRARLLREAQAMARLTHPNVVQVYEAGEHGDEIYVVMELIAGADLRTWLHRRERPPGWREVLELLLQAGHGLAAAHAAGLVHRDFKPENVFVGDDGRVRVGDFGLAGASAGEGTDAGEPSAERVASLTATGAVMGTPAYMAPEQHLGRPSDARTDLFAFCVTLWEALCGERPFPGESPHALAAAVTAGHRRTPPRGRRAPPWLWAALEKGLQSDPDARFPSMDALLVHLEAELGDGAPRREDPRRARRNELLLLEKVQSFWIEGILRRGVADVTLAVEFDERPERVDRGGAHRLDEASEPRAASPSTSPNADAKGPGPAERPEDAGADIAARFTAGGRSLLLLGAPGAGKTIALLTIAEALLQRAVEDPDEPLPVVLSLASWGAQAQPLDAWIVDELAALYRIPRRLARRWIDEGALVLLLDGLDEVPAPRRAACAAAINRFCDDQGLTSIAVTCRDAELTELGVRLRLAGAVELRPLRDDVVDRALAAGEGPSADLRAHLAEDPGLREFARVPLFLGILRRIAADDPAGLATAEPEERRLRILDRYVRGALDRARTFAGVTGAGGRASVGVGVDERRAVRWLGWLGRAVIGGRGVFLLESLQPRDLASARARWAYVLLTRCLVAALPLAWLATVAGGVRGWPLRLALAVLLVVTIAGGRLLSAGGTAVARRSGALAVFLGVFAVFLGASLFADPALLAAPARWFASKIGVLVVIAGAAALTYVDRRRRLALGLDVRAAETLRLDRGRFARLVGLIALAPALALGAFLAFQGRDPAAVWDVASGERRPISIDAEDGTYAVGWTARGEVIVGGDDERARVLDLADRRVTARLDGASFRVSADGRRVAGSVVGDDGREHLQLWSDGAWSSPLAIDLGDPAREPREPLAFSAEGETLLVGYADDGGREATGYALVEGARGRVIHAFPEVCSASADAAGCTRSLELGGDRRRVVRTRGDQTIERLALDPLRPLAEGDPGALDRSPTDAVIAEATLGGAALEEALQDAAGERVALVLDDGGRARTEVWDLAARARLLSVRERGVLSPDGRALFTLRRVEAPLPVAAALFLVGLLIAALLSFRPGMDPGRIRVNEGIRRSIGRAALTFVATFTLVIAVFVAWSLSTGLHKELTVDRFVGFPAFLGVGLAGTLALLLGGSSVIGHGVLRVQLALSGDAPLAYGRFLERAAERALLRRVGGGYVFVHRVLAEYFAEHASRRLTR